MQSILPISSMPISTKKVSLSLTLRMIMAIGMQFHHNGTLLPASVTPSLTLMVMAPQIQVLLVLTL